MKRLIPLAVILLMGAAPASKPVPLSAQPGTWMEAAARALVRQDVSEARRAGEVPLMLVGSAKLSNRARDRESLFVQLQSPRECGSAGCSTTVYTWQNGTWTRVLDGIGGKLSVASRHTKGMADLLTENQRFVWTGKEYRDSRPAPAVDLRPRKP